MEDEYKASEYAWDTLEMVKQDVTLSNCRLKPAARQNAPPGRHINTHTMKTKELFETLCRLEVICADLRVA